MTFILTSHTAAAFFLGIVTIGVIALFTFIVQNFKERYPLFISMLPFAVAWVVLFTLAFGVPA